MALRKGHRLWVSFLDLLVTCVVVHKLLGYLCLCFSHLSNEDIIPTPLWAVRRLSHIGQTPSTMPSIVLCFFHYSSSLLGTGQRLTLAGLCPLAPAPWIMANPTQEPKRSRSSRKYWPAGTGKFPSHSLPNIDLLLEGPEPPSSGCGPGWFVSLQIHCV